MVMYTVQLGVRMGGGLASPETNNTSPDGVYQAELHTIIAIIELQSIS